MRAAVTTAALRKSRFARATSAYLREVLDHLLGPRPVHLEVVLAAEVAAHLGHYREFMIQTLRTRFCSVRLLSLFLSRPIGGGLPDIRPTLARGTMNATTAGGRLSPRGRPGRDGDST